MEFFLEPYRDADLELRKKASLFVTVLPIGVVLLSVLLAMEIAMDRPLVVTVPIMLCMAMCIGSLALIRRGWYETAAAMVILAIFLVQNIVIVADPYDNPFEMYRYTLSIATGLMVSAVLMLHRGLLVGVTLLGSLGIAFFYFFRYGLEFGIWREPVSVASLVTSLAVYLFLGFVATCIHYITRMLIRANAEERDRAIVERDRAAQRLELISLYTKPSVVAQIQAGDDPARSRPERRDLAILFCDIRDFSGISENLDPLAVVELLNPYFTLMTEQIMEHGGEVDKLMGDCIMAVFPDAPGALAAARGMRAALDGETRLGVSNLRHGIGIHRGPVIAGNIGSAWKMDHTVIGEAVNVASRLEGLTRAYRCGLIVSGEVAEADPDGFIRIDRVRLRGSSGNMDIYGSFDAADDPGDAELVRTQPELMVTALGRYLAGDFNEAEALYRGLAAAAGPDGYFAMMAGRCAGLARLSAAGGLTWDGFFDHNRLTS